jgi:hypothetical protein
LILRAANKMKWPLKRGKLIVLKSESMYQSWNFVGNLGGRGCLLICSSIVTCNAARSWPVVYYSSNFREVSLPFGRRKWPWPIFGGCAQGADCGQKSATFCSASVSGKTGIFGKAFAVRHKQPHAYYVS